MKLQSSFRPRLIHRTKADTKKVGYLRLSDDGTPVCIGPVDSREYRLVQSLFNPTNTDKARFCPVFQTEERAYENMVLSGGVTRKGAAQPNVALARTLKSIQKTEAGKFLSFVQSNQRIVMYINQERD